MKKPLGSCVLALSALLLLSGCIGIGGGDKHIVQKPTVGQQLVDLKKARDTGAITENEYQAQKTKLLEASK